jgi:predicted porin
MRKILLGSTAIAAAALFAPGDAYAQLPAANQELQVRIGGYFRFNYAFVDQSLNNQGSGGTDTASGKNDFASDAEIQVIVAGKSANGLTYGALIELQVDARNDSSTTGSKTFADTDEMWLFLASPTLGQLRFGDEDGVAMGLMGSGHITNFGTGGADGDAGDYLHSGLRPGFVYPSGALNDSSKIVYLSPQFFGFDAGISFAFNQGEGEDTGCVGTTVTGACDRASVEGNRRRNETQLALRWRGSFSGVGLSFTGAAIFADSMKNINPSVGGTTGSNEAFRYYTVGAQVNGLLPGLLFGGHYSFGDLNSGGGPLLRPGTGSGANRVIDDTTFSQWFVGASYTVGQLIVGANFAYLTSAGFQTQGTGTSAGIAGRSDRTEKAFGIGAAYNLAPGLQVVAEYTYIEREENGFDFRSAGAGAANNSVDASVFILGTRIAF